MDQFTEEEKAKLTSGGDCDLHNHSADRVMTADTYQQIARVKIVTHVTADYVATYKDDIVVDDATTAAVSVTLPPAKNSKEITVVRGAGIGICTVLFSGSDTFFGVTSFVLSSSGNCVTFKAITGGYMRIA